MRHGVLLLPVFLCCVAAADDGQEDDRLQGDWVVRQMERGGRPAPPKLAASMKVAISGDTLTLSDGKGGESATFALDRGKEPHEIDLVFKEGPKKEVERTALGIYELDGDTLKLAWRKDGGPRPTEFASIKGQRTSEFLILKRAEAK